MCFALYTVAIGFSRALSTDPLLVLHGSDDVEGLRSCRGAVGLNGLIGIAIGIVVAVVGLVVGGSFGPIALAVGLSMPILLTQDGVRYSLIARRRPDRALAVDLVWMVVMVAAVVGASRAGSPRAGPTSRSGRPVPSCRSCSPNGGSRASVVLARAEVVLPEPPARLALRRRVRGRGRSAAGGPPRRVDRVVGRGRCPARWLGPLRAARDPARRPGERGPGGGLQGMGDGILRRAQVFLGVLLVLVIVADCAWGLLAWVIPESVGTAILGDTWSGAHQLVPALTANVVSTAALLLGMAGLRGRRPGRSDDADHDPHDGGRRDRRGGWRAPGRGRGRRLGHGAADHRRRRSLLWWALVTVRHETRS